MTEAGANTIDNGASPYCVLAWWDVDMQIGAYKKRKVTARPLRNLERSIGHRVHVESRSTYLQMKAGYWKFEAYNYLDVSDPAIAAYSVLQQISGIAEWFSGVGYRSVQSTSDDADQDRICAFYWSDHGESEAYRHIQSGGIMLLLANKSRSSKLQYSRWELGDSNRQEARPIVGVCQPPQARSDYQVSLVVQFFCNNRQKLQDVHWPKLKEKYGLRDADAVDFGEVPPAGEPNLIGVTAVLNAAMEQEAIAYCLARTERCRFKLGGAGDTVFLAERFPHQEAHDGVYSISLTRMANA